MMILCRTFILLIITVMFPVSCNASDSNDDKTVDVSKLVKKYLSPKIVIGPDAASSVINGDFNGDGVIDLAMLFLPVSEMTASNNLNISKLWENPDSVSSANFHKSLVIFHGSKSGWLSGDMQVYVLLDDIGALETPSFKLIVSHVRDKDYKDNALYLPVKLQSDLIIIPTEAGIDTYIYWHQGRYQLFEPDELP
ncbi:MAG: hypothetical protein GY951_14260 [Psychromonas sp.]|nr:hypothetical protein [Psychromonas sp.]